MKILFNNNKNVLTIRVENRCEELPGVALNGFWHVLESS